MIKIDSEKKTPLEEELREDELRKAVKGYVEKLTESALDSVFRNIKANTLSQGQDAIKSVSCKRIGERFISELRDSLVSGVELNALFEEFENATSSESHDEKLSKSEEKNLSAATMPTSEAEDLTNNAEVNKSDSNTVQNMADETEDTELHEEVPVNQQQEEEKTQRDTIELCSDDIEQRAKTYLNDVIKYYNSSPYQENFGLLKEFISFAKVFLNRKKNLDKIELTEEFKNVLRKLLFIESFFDSTFVHHSYIKTCDNLIIILANKMRYVTKMNLDSGSLAEYDGNWHISDVEYFSLPDYIKNKMQDADNSTKLYLCRHISPGFQFEGKCVNRPQVTVYYPYFCLSKQSIYLSPSAYGTDTHIVRLIEILIKSCSIEDRMKQYKVDKDWFATFLFEEPDAKSRLIEKYPTLKHDSKYTNFKKFFIERCDDIGFKTILSKNDIGQKFKVKNFLAFIEEKLSKKGIRILDYIACSGEAELEDSNVLTIKSNGLMLHSFIIEKIDCIVEQYKPTDEDIIDEVFTRYNLLQSALYSDIKLCLKFNKHQEALQSAKTKSAFADFVAWLETNDFSNVIEYLIDESWILEAEDYKLLCDKEKVLPEKINKVFENFLSYFKGQNKKWNIIGKDAIGKTIDNLPFEPGILEKIKNVSVEASTNNKNKQETIKSVIKTGIAHYETKAIWILPIFEVYKLKSQQQSLEEFEDLINSLCEKKKLSKPKEVNITSRLKSISDMIKKVDELKLCKSDEEIKNSLKLAMRELNLLFSKNPDEYIIEHFNKSLKCSDDEFSKDDSPKIEDYSEFLNDLWDEMKDILKQKCIQEIEIKPGETKVGTYQRERGWIMKNDEGLAPETPEMNSVVYGVKEIGISFKDEVIKAPIVNVYW